jgi:hypothetical protein
MGGLEGQERSGFPQIHRLLSRLPVPVQKKTRSMTHAQAIEGQFRPNMGEEEQKRFTPSELILYKHALEYKWTVEQLKKVIAMVSDPEFDSKAIDPDLHKRMEKAVEDGRIKCLNMREGPADGDQDLNFWTRDMEDLVREIMEDLQGQSELLVRAGPGRGWSAIVWRRGHCNSGQCRSGIPDLSIEVHTMTYS